MVARGVAALVAALAVAAVAAQEDPFDAARVEVVSCSG